MPLRDRYEEKYFGSTLCHSCNWYLGQWLHSNKFINLSSACQSGGPDCRGRRAWWTCRERCQVPHQRIGRGPAKSKTGHGSPNQRIPGPDECQAGFGHWDCHLQEVAGGRGGQASKWHQGYQHLPTEQWVIFDSLLNNNHEKIQIFFNCFNRFSLFLSLTIFLCHFSQQQAMVVFRWTAWRAATQAPTPVD